MAFPAILFTLYFALFVWDEFYGVLFFLSGLFLLDRNFAYIHITFYGFPIYLVEFCLILWALCLVYRKPAFIMSAWRSLPVNFRWFWSLYLAMGCISLAKGVNHYPLARVMRDSALVYYSLGILLIMALDLSFEKLRIVMITLASCALAKALADCLSHAYLPVGFATFFLGQPAAVSLLLGMALLSYAAINKLCISSLRAYGWLVLLSSAILTDAVRSTWTGICVAVLVLIGLLCFQLPLRTIVKRVCVLGALIGLGSVTVLKLMSLNFQKPSKLQPTFTTPVPAPTPTPTPISQPIAKPVAPPSPKPMVQRPPPLPIVSPVPTSVVTPALPNVPAVVKPAEPERPLDRALKKFTSFAQGRQSPNVMTRLLMWEDAIDEVFSVGLFSPTLSEKDLTRYKIRWDETERRNHVWKIRVSARNLSDYAVYIHVVENNDIPPTTLLSEITRALTGLPFGKMFLPPQIVWDVDAINRYDPHNELIAILYRLGLLGLMSFLGLVAVTWRWCYTYLKGNSLKEHSRTILLAAAVCTVCHVVHSLTDNTLENAFKGLWFWFLIGIIFAVPRLQRSGKNL